jgi:hypothetical protein
MLSKKIIDQSATIQILGFEINRQFKINDQIIKSEPLSETYDIVWENI